MALSRTAPGLGILICVISACSDLTLEHVGAGGSAPTTSASSTSTSAVTASSSSQNGSGGNGGSANNTASAVGVGGMTTSSVGTGGATNTSAVTSTNTSGSGGQVPVLFGDTIVEQSIDNHTPGTAEASGFVASASGTVNTLSVYYYDGNAGQLLVGFYDDLAGHPHNLLASGTIAAPVTGAWNTVAVSPKVGVMAGNSYWIALVAPANSGTFFQFPYLYIASALNTEHSMSLSLLSLPDPWISGQVFAPSRNSFYASP